MLCLVRWKLKGHESAVVAELSKGEQADLEQILIMAVENGPLTMGSVKEIELKSMENILDMLTEEDDGLAPPPIREATR
jgi:hypothetical protein